MESPTFRRCAGHDPPSQCGVLDVHFKCRNSVLHMNDTCLYVRPKTLQRSAAWHRLACEHRAWGVDGQRQGRASLTMSLLEAIATLCDAGACVGVVLKEGDSGLFVSDHELRIGVVDVWDPEVVLADQEPRSQDARCVVHHDSTRRAQYTWVIAGIAPPFGLVCPDDAPWNWLVREEALGIRVARLRDDTPSSNVRVYRDGVLLESSCLPHAASAPKGTLLIALVGDASSQQPFPVHSRDVFTRVCIREDWSQHPLVVTHLLDRAVRDWARSWPANREVLCDASMGDWSTRLIDASDLFEWSVFDPQMHALGMSLLHRLQPTAAVASSEVQGSVLALYRVSQIRALPITSERLSQLHRCGCFASNATNACQWGLVSKCDDDDTLHLMLGCDATRDTMALAAISLLSESVRGRNESGGELPVRLLLCSGVSHSEAHTTCEVHDRLESYRIRLDPAQRVVALERDCDTEAKMACEAVTVDSLDMEQVAFDDQRRVRNLLLKMFPGVCRRLREQNVPVACLHEVQARRLAHTWSMDGLDGTSNASSLGLSILLAATLGFWHGARVRVFLARSHAALVGVSNADGSFLLVDPTRTLKNAFDLSRSLSHTTESGYSASIYKGSAVEVKWRSYWHLATVLNVINSRTVCVLFADPSLSDRKRMLNLFVDEIRPLAQCGRSLVSTTLIKLMNRCQSGRAVHSASDACNGSVACARLGAGETAERRCSSGAGSSSGDLGRKRSLSCRDSEGSL